MRNTVQAAKPRGRFFTLQGIFSPGNCRWWTKSPQNTVAPKAQGQQMPCLSVQPVRRTGSAITGQLSRSHPFCTVTWSDLAEEIKVPVPVCH